MAANTVLNRLRSKQPSQGAAEKRQRLKTLDPLFKIRAVSRMDGLAVPAQWAFAS